MTTHYAKLQDVLTQNIFHTFFSVFYKPQRPQETGFATFQTT